MIFTMKSLFFASLLALSVHLGATYTVQTACDNIPSGYYDSLNSVPSNDAAALRAAVHALVFGHKRLPYTSSASDAWDLITSADKGDSPNTVKCIYSNKTFSTNDFYSSSNTDGYSREHTWPKSYGFPDDNECNAAFTDGHHLFAVQQTINAARGNKRFADCDSECTAYPIDGAAASSAAAATANVAGRFTWSVWAGSRGDAARAQFYMDVRYEGGKSIDESCANVNEIDLILTNDDTLVRTSGENANVGYHGNLNTLLQWHAADAVAARECSRNAAVAALQGKRNPFIDIPSLAADIYADGESAGSGASPPPLTTTTTTATAANDVVCVTELHYDNAGDDENEGFELSAVAGVDLSLYEVLLYNGASGEVYDTIALSGAVAAEAGGGGGGAVWFDHAGLQNGAPDGLALVHKETSRVVQFISYEGTLTATNGAASGKTSTDIGAEQSNSDASLTLQASGSVSPSKSCDSALSWALLSATRGKLNAQLFLSATEEEDDGGALSGSATAMIVLFLIALLAAAVVGSVYYKNKKRNGKSWIDLGRSMIGGGGTSGRSRSQSRA